MSTYSIYFSPTGGTKRVMDCLAQGWDKAEALDLSDPTTDYSSFSFGAEDLCLIGVPSFGGRVPQTAVERLGKMKADRTPAVLVCVYGNRAYEDTLLELSDTLTAAGFRPRAAVAAIAEHSIMHQFAAGRPDEADARELAEFAERIKVSLMEDADKELTLPGNRPYKLFGGTLKPSVTESCTGCGICAKVCPVQAISVDNPKNPAEERCISCMRCVAVCPDGGRVVDGKLLEGLVSRIGKALEGHKENELMLP